MDIACRQKENILRDAFAAFVKQKAQANAYIVILIYSALACLIFFLQTCFTSGAYGDYRAYLFYFWRSFFPAFPQPQKSERHPLCADCALYCHHHICQYLKSWNGDPLICQKKKNQKTNLFSVTA